MDFNRRIASFETQFRTLDNLLHLARTCHVRRPSLKPTLLFVSSIAVVGQYPKLSGECIVPEIAMQDNRSADDFGYAKAKLVCERMIEGAAKVLGKEVNAKYVRVGQLTGAEKTGLWNATEHFPALVKSSKLIDALPDLKGVRLMVISKRLLLTILRLYRGSQLIMRRPLQSTFFSAPPREWFSTLRTQFVNLGMMC